MKNEPYRNGHCNVLQNNLVEDYGKSTKQIVIGQEISSNQILC